MDRKQLKNIHFGKVTSFDGILGNIITEKQEYMFFASDVIGDLGAKTGDYVEFREEKIKKGTEETPVARFVFVKRRDNLYQMEHKFLDK